VDRLSGTVSELGEGGGKGEGGGWGVEARVVEMVEGGGDGGEWWRRRVEARVVNPVRARRGWGVSKAGPQVR
jgi:hypothetical protein